MSISRFTAGSLWARLRPGWAAVALLAILATAAYLRLRGISWGLPYSFQNADESLMVEKGFSMARGNVNPGWFYYPSFFFAMLGALYWFTGLVLHGAAAASFVAPGALVLDPTPFFLSARLLVATCGVVSVYLLYRIGTEGYSRSVGLLAALFLAVTPLHVRYSHVAVTDVPAVTLGLLALLFFVRATQRRSGRALFAGALAAGLATSTKYNLGMLVLPAAVAAWYACGDPARRRGVLSFTRHLASRVAMPMAIAFLVGSPFALLDLPHFLRDLSAQNRIVADGWLGFERVDSGYWYNLAVNLPSSLGLVLVLLGMAGLVLAAASRRRVDFVLVPYVVVYYLYVSSWAELMDRYLLPIVPLLIVLAVRACVMLAGTTVVRRRVATFATAFSVVAVLAVAFVLPLQASIRYADALQGVDVRTVAKSWVERHITSGAVIAAEPYGPPVVSRADLHLYREAGHRPAAYRIVQLKLPLPQKPDRCRTFAYLDRRGVRYVIVSSQVYERVLAATDVYPIEVRFYRALAARATLLKTFSPGAGESGPVIKIYEL